MTPTEKTTPRGAKTAAEPAPISTIALVAGILSIPGAVAGLLGLILPVVALVAVVVSVRAGESALKRRIFAVILAVVGVALALGSAAIGHYISG